MKIRDAMTPNVTMIRADAPVRDAMLLMLENKFSGLPVVATDGSLVGMVTEGDLMRRAELGTERRRPRWLEFLVGPGRLAADYTQSHARQVADVMTHNVTTIELDASLADAVHLMEKHRIKRLPVLDKGRLAGMLSRSDIMRAFVGLQPAAAALEMSDELLEQRIKAEIDAQLWCPRSLLVRANKGTAELSGVITDDRTRDALRVLVQNIPGVSRVVDHLVTVEPVSGAIITSPAEVEKRAAS